MLFLGGKLNIGLAFFHGSVKTRGRLLLAMLLHASINTAPGVLLPTLFPPLTTLFVLSWLLVWVMVAPLVIAATRGRLSYQRCLREAARANLAAPSLCA